MKISVRLQLKGCQIEFVKEFGPGIVAIGEIEIEGATASIEEIIPAIKARMLDRLFDIEYLIEEEPPKLLEVQKFDESHLPQTTYYH